MKQLCRHLIETLIEPKRILGLKTLPSFIHGFIKLRQAGEDVRLRDLWPQLGDCVSRTPFDPHYLYQGAWVARKLAASKPPQHWDIGSDSRLMAAISAFIPIVFSDIRLLDVSLSSLKTQRVDACNLDWPIGTCQSLSCLHVIEHIGLGRYGDPIDPLGPARACAEFVRVLAPTGRLYLTTPVGRPRIQFNAHRVFDPIQVLQLLSPLSLHSFSFVDDEGKFHANADIQEAAQLSYGCGMYEFCRNIV